MVAKAVIRTPFLRSYEVLKFQGVAQEKDGRVVPNQVVVAFAGIELQRKTARIAPCIRTTTFARHGGEPDQNVRFRTRLEHRRLGVGTNIVGHLEMPERSGTLGVRLPLGDTFAIEVGHLLDEVMVMQQNWAIGSNGQRVFVTGDGAPRIFVVGFDSFFIMLGLLYNCSIY